MWHMYAQHHRLVGPELCIVDSVTERQCALLSSGAANDIMAAVEDVRMTRLTLDLDLTTLDSTFSVPCMGHVHAGLRF